MNVQFDKESCYNLDMILGRIIADGLQEFKKHIVGVPAIIEGDTIEDSMANWRKMLDEMIWAFEESANGYKNRPDGTKLGIEEFDKRIKKYEERVRHGRFMFADYFSDMWI